MRNEEALNVIVKEADRQIEEYCRKHPKKPEVIFLGQSEITVLRNFYRFKCFPNDRPRFYGMDLVESPDVSKIEVR